MLWVGVLLLSTLAVARWPDRIVADARGVRWTDEDGASRFFENENALVVTGAIPWMREVVCVRDGFRKCMDPLRNVPDLFSINYNWCVQMKCTASPSTDKIEIAYPDFPSMSVHAGKMCTEGGLCNPNDRTPFNPDEFILNLRAVESLSLLWHIK